MFVSRAPSRQATPVVGSYDVIVCGGGPAGLVAATAAARNGATTLLIERYGFVGGMATSALVTPISEFRHFGKQHIGGIPFELMPRRPIWAAPTSRGRAATTRSTTRSSSSPRSACCSRAA